jgi:hypothetical protein
MQMDLSTYLESQPYLFHTTAALNVDGLRRDKRIYSAESLLSEAVGRPFALDEIRPKSITFERVDGGTVVVRDVPFAEGAIQYEDGWDRARFMRRLNRLVFFWPGKPDGQLRRNGRNHYDRYVGAQEKLAVLRIRAGDLIRDANTFFSRVNSGAPRTSSGKKGLRGSGTFRQPGSFDGSPADVIEVAMEHFIDLPANTEISNDLVHWRRFFQ